MGLGVGPTADPRGSHTLRASLSCGELAALDMGPSLASLIPVLPGRRLVVSASPAPPGAALYFRRALRDQRGRRSPDRSAPPLLADGHDHLRGPSRKGIGATVPRVGRTGIGGRALPARSATLKVERVAFVGRTEPWATLPVSW